VIKREEFVCPCCGENETKQELVNMVFLARTLAGIPFIINSGYRCKKHNLEVGGRIGSSHPKGEACDIACVNSSERYNMIESLHLAGFRRMGIGKTFIHADMDNSKTQRVTWLYS